jgi:hypothetical protein
MRPVVILSLAALLTASCTSIDMASSKQNQPRCEASRSEPERYRKAFFFAYPLYEMSRMRQRTLSLPGARPNSLIHRSRISGPSDRSITMPNTDTLYSTAWLDLSGGPVRFSIPAMGKRYHSIQLMDAFSDVFAILRNETDETREFLIVGPGWTGEADTGVTVIRAPSRDLWLVGRTFVEGPQDLADAQALQQAYAIEETAALPLGISGRTRIPKTPSAEEFLTVVNAGISRGTIPDIHQDRLVCFSSAGIGNDPDAITPDEQTAIEANWENWLEPLLAETRQALDASGTLRNGWRYPGSNIGQFGDDDLYRSAIALGGLAALPTYEAVNPITVRDSEGMRLNGASRYRLQIPADVPVDGFWSLTLYESDGAGRWSLYENPIDRFAVRSTSDEFFREPDGSIALEISNRKPVSDLNWLPAPDGPFLLAFRAYRPRPPFADGTFALGSIERIAGS